MKWIQLENEQQLEEIKLSSGYSLIFKHSTRCSISMMAKKRFELDWDELPEATNLYFLDLIRFRTISTLIAETFNIHHESPQLLLIKGADCVYEASHGEISAEDAAKQITVFK